MSQFQKEQNSHLISHNFKKTVNFSKFYGKYIFEFHDINIVSRFVDFVLSKTQNKPNHGPCRKDCK